MNATVLEAAPPGPGQDTEAPPRFTECLAHGNAPPSSADQSRQVMHRLQELIEQIEAQTNPSARALLQECLQTLLSFYGEGLARILEQLEAGEEGRTIRDRLLHDQMVSGLLLIHGLHPVPLETRLRGALEKVRPYLQSHGGNIELLRLENDVAQVRLQGTCKTCPSSAITLELAVRRAVEEACPDLLAFQVEGIPPAPAPKQAEVSPTNGVPINSKGS